MKVQKVVAGLLLGLVALTSVGAANELKTVCLDANNGKGNLYWHTSPSKDNRNHLFDFQTVHRNSYRIISRATGQALTYNKKKGVFLSKYDSENLDQVWRIEGPKWNSRFFNVRKTIKPAYFNGCLDAGAGKSVYVHNKPDTGNPNHLFIITFDGQIQPVAKMQ